MNLEESDISILVVDDQPDNFDTIELLLSQDNYQLHYASNGFEALMHLEENQPDLILMDLMMPGMSGIEAIERIKKNRLWLNIPIIMVTALSSNLGLARCLEAGADDFIVKPVNSIELRARVKSMLRIHQQYLALEDSLQLRTDLANMLVHDLRSPLSTIMLSCDLVQRCNLTDRQKRPIERISIASRQLQSMIDSLLTLAKLESGKLVLQKELTDLVQIVKQVAQDFEAIAAHKQLQIKCISSKTTHTFYLDQVIFRRVLDNLMSNAIKFSPLGGEITLSILYPQPQQAIVQVIDQGRGIKDEVKKSIFEKFEVGEIIRGVAQTGLGLAFCKMAIAAHGGNLKVTDNKPSGSIFSVSIAFNSFPNAI